MTHAAITSQVHQALDIHRRLSTQITFDRQLGDFVADGIQIGLIQLTHLSRWVHASRVADLLCGGATNPVDVGQRDPRVFVIWDIYSGNTCHLYAPFIFLMHLQH